MANESGTTSAPQTKAVEKKSGNVSGDQVQQMLLKREAKAEPKSPSAEHVEPAPAKTVEPTAETPAPSEETPKASQPDKVEKAEPETKEPEPTPPDEVLSTLSQEQRDRIDRRIGKEVGKRKALEDEVARLRTLIEATRSSTPPPAASVVEPTADNPLAKVNDANELARQKRIAEETKDWAQDQLDRDDFTEVKVDGRSYTKADLKQVVRNSERLISRHIPQRLEFIQMKSQADRQTAELFGAEPWMQDKTSEGYQAYLQILSDPDIAKRPAASWLAAVQVQGLLDVKRRKTAAGKTEEITPPKPKAPGSQTATGAGLAPAREPGEGRAVKQLQAELERLKGKKGVSGRDVEAYLLRMEESRSTR